MDSERLAMRVREIVTHTAGLDFRTETKIDTYLQEGKRYVVTGTYGLPWAGRNIAEGKFRIVFDEELRADDVKVAPSTLFEKILEGKMVA